MDYAMDTIFYNKSLNIRPKDKPVFLVGVLIFAALPQSAHSGGIGLYEIGTPDVGLASAGYSARAQDASTLFKNPAGMSRLHGSQIQGGGQFLYGDVEFSPDGNTSPRLGSDGGGNAIGALPGLSLFYVHDFSDKWKFGLGAFSNFGLVEEYNENWVGRYYVQKSALVGVSIMPSVSYKATDWLSIGVGLNAMFGYLKDEVAINNRDPRVGDGQMTLKDNTWGFGANVGILIEPREGTRFGITYQSQINLDFAATPSYSNLGPGLSKVLANPSSVNLGMNVPQSVMFGFYQQIDDEWAIMGDVGWQDWSQFGRVDIGLQSSDSGTLTANLNYQDTWHGAIGVQYKAFPDWVFTSGFAYDSSAVSNANRTVVLPMGEAWRFGLGALWQVTQKLDVNASYEFMWNGDMPVNQGTDNSLRGQVSGSYDNAWFSFFALNFTYRF